MSPEAPIALFVTCLNDTLFPRVGQDTVRLLERLGHEVSFPAGQTCCGQMHINSGYGHEALPMLRRFRAAFADQELIVSPSASCVATVRHHYPALAREAGDPGLAADLEALTPRVLELCDLLTARLGLTDVGASFPHRVAYHPTCHSLRGLALGDAPQRLLRAVRRARAGRARPTRRSAAGSAAPSPSRTPTPQRRCWPTSSPPCGPAAQRSAPPSTARA